MRSQLQQLKDMGVRRLVALRGDLPSGYGLGGEFQYASDLVAFIRAEFGDFFHIEVAAYPEVHPQARSPEADLRALAAKVQAGANSAITQYFFNADAYARFVDDAQRLGRGYSRSSGYHADPQRNPAHALFRCDRRRNPPAGYASGSRPLATIRPRSAPSAWMWSLGCVNSCALSRRPRFALLHDEPKYSHLGAVRPLGLVNSPSFLSGGRQAVLPP